MLHWGSQGHGQHRDQLQGGQPLGQQPGRVRQQPAGITAEVTAEEIRGLKQELNDNLAKICQLAAGSQLIVSKLQAVESQLAREEPKTPQHRHECTLYYNDINDPVEQSEPPPLKPTITF